MNKEPKHLLHRAGEVKPNSRPEGVSPLISFQWLKAAKDQQRRTIACDSIWWIAQEERVLCGKKEWSAGSAGLAAVLLEDLGGTIQ